MKARSKVTASIAIVALAIIALIVVSGLRAGTAQQSSAVRSSSSQIRTGFVKGLAFTPASYDSAGTTDFFAKASQAGSVVEWAGDWDQLDGPGGPATVAQLASRNGQESMIAVQFFTQSTGQLIRPLNATNEQHYLSITEEFARQYRPSYLAVGIEVNLLYEKNPTSFAEFVKFYSQVYSSVKSVSPETDVFTVFQLEKMNGLGGGLYGGVNDPNSSEWQLLSQFPQDDVAAFTTYPSLVYQSPADIPSGYYSSIAVHTNRSVGFTEIGWNSASVSGGWKSNESEQSAFVARFFSLTSTLARAFAVWSFLYDQSAPVPFDSMGLIYVNGTTKESWEAWQEAA